MMKPETTTEPHVRDQLSEDMARRAARDEEMFSFDDMLPTLNFEQAEAALHLEERLKLLNEIGLALSAVHNIDELLDLILAKARELTGADAGSLFLIENSDTLTVADDRLIFRKAQNDSIQVNTTKTFPVSASSLAGYAALSGETLVFEDVYKLPAHVPYQFNPSFDKEFGYRTKSVLVVPMRSHMGGMLGVLQLINRKRNRDVKLTDNETVQREVIQFDRALTEMAASLASQAAVAIENSRFVERIRSLFESFVTASASAIEDRDPSTSGHSQRVTNLTVGLAIAAHRATAGPFADTNFTPLELRTLRYAGLLHDFGKIGVRENILTKSHKLEPDKGETIKCRILSLRQERKAHFALLEAAVLREHLPQPGGGEVAEKLCEELRQQQTAEWEESQKLLVMLDQANNPAVTMLPDDEYNQQQELLQRLAHMTYETASGEREPLISAEDIDSLSIRKGSLTREEYRKIQDHAQLSYEFLTKIRWTEEYARIPTIAWGHHEKLNGKGYPRGVTATEIPMETRFMTVADIFDALTAADRPYKKAMPVDRALKILGFEATEGGLDANAVMLFSDQKIYEKITVPSHEQIEEFEKTAR